MKKLLLIFCIIPCSCVNTRKEAVTYSALVALNQLYSTEHLASISIVPQLKATQEQKDRLLSVYKKSQDTWFNIYKRLLNLYGVRNGN